jgi:hypothetical protein
MEHKWSQSLEVDGNVTVPLAELVSEKLPWLFRELGFRILESNYDANNFGDSLVVLQSDRIRLRFERDRGQVLVALGPLSEPRTWWGLISLCEVIRKESVEPRHKLDALGAILRENLPALAEALGPKLLETRQEIEKRQQERLKALGLQSANARTQRRK